MKKIILGRWKESDEHRAQWDQFIHSPAFDAGMRVMESQAGAVLYPGESETTIAHRHAFQSGFHAALELFSKLPELGEVSQNEFLKGWEELFGHETDEEENLDQA